MADLATELAVALERMVDATCPSMRALWLLATQRERRDLSGEQGAADDIELPAPFAGWKKSRLSKYGALATFRHAVVWRLAEEQWRPPSAAGRIYFTPCEDAPPFHAGGADARSSRGREELERVRSHLAALIRSLRASRDAREERPLNEEFVAGGILDKATRKTLRDVLKLDDGRFDSLFVDSAEGDE